MRWRAGVLACASLIVVTWTPASAACSASRGDRIVLNAAGLDPDVFVWDSARRLVDYANGADDVDVVMHHTTLAPAGTHALVVSCRSSAARLHPTNSLIDLIGVRLIDGRNRGRYGWVYATDTWRDGKMPKIPTADVNHSQ